MNVATTGARRTSSPKAKRPGIKMAARAARRAPQSRVAGVVRCQPGSGRHVSVAVVALEVTGDLEQLCAQDSEHRRVELSVAFELVWHPLEVECDLA